MVEKKTISICGESCQITLYSNKQGDPQWVRMLLDGTWCLTPEQAARLHSEEQEHQHLQFDFGSGDDSVTIKGQRLIQYGKAASSDAELEAIGDRFLTEVETLFPILEDCCTSSSWWVGHKEDTWDSLLTQQERTLLNRATRSLPE